MPNKIVIFLLGTLASCLLAAGCGGGSDGKEIDKAAFIKETKRICEQASGKMAAEINAFGTTGNFEQTQLALIKQSLTPGLKTELDEIRALGIPEGDGKQVRPFLVEMKKMVEQAETNPQAFVSSGKPYYATEIAGRRYGVTGCPLTAVEAG